MEIKNNHKEIIFYNFDNCAEAINDKLTEDILRLSKDYVAKCVSPIFDGDDKIKFLKTLENTINTHINSHIETIRKIAEKTIYNKLVDQTHYVFHEIRSDTTHEVKQILEKLFDEMFDVAREEHTNELLTSIFLDTLIAAKEAVSSLLDEMANKMKTCEHENEQQLQRN